MKLMNEPPQLLVLLLSFCSMLLLINVVVAEDPYKFFDWTITYGDIYPLGVKQQGILINGQFPGPEIHSVTNDNLIINVHNNLSEPFLLTWNGVQQRRNSYQDGVYGTTCPIPPGKNFTYTLQVKDQIGSFFYFPSLAFHKAAGGFGAINIVSRPLIPVPFPEPANDYSILIGDWYHLEHTRLRRILDFGHRLPFPQGVLINGRANGSVFSVEPGKTYRLRISNVGLQNTLNFRIQGHTLKLVEVEGTHTIQTTYSSIDVHVGQSYSVLVTADQAPKDYYIAVSTRFTHKVILTSTANLHYSNSQQPLSGPIPGGPTTDIEWSIQQARSIRTNLTASGPRPNPQGSYHYGQVNVSRTIILKSSAAQVNGKQRYAVNSVSFIPADTPLKLADHFKIDGVFKVGSIPDTPSGKPMYLDTSVMGADFRAFVEIVFQNRESIVQSWHLDGYSFWVVGMDYGEWTPNSRKEYNLADAVSRSTTQLLIMTSETSEHDDSSHVPSIANTTNTFPPKRKNRSEAWNHFIPEVGSSPKAAKCNYCEALIQYNNGTSSMHAHLGRCPLNPANLNRMHDTASSSVDMGGVVSSSPSYPKFDQDACRVSVVNMFIALEIPFNKVDHPRLHKAFYDLQPRYKVQSRTTLARDILKQWEIEKARLKIFLQQHCRRVCLTTDTWTSNQNFNYMCLTAHFIDNNWRLQKRILNFSQVTEYSGESMAKTLEHYLNGWGLDHVLTVTVDNASSNDVGVQHLKRWLQSRNGLVMNGDFFHMRCCAHILNLIVKEGLKDMDDAVYRIRSAVRYVRRSPARLNRFKQCIDKQSMSYKGYVGLDCETRWNATYTMLNSALKHKKTFEELSFRDQKYVNELAKDKGVPKPEDWEHVELLLPFLKMFYEATLRISGSSYLTSNIYMYEVFGIGKEIVQMCDSRDERLSSIAKKMKKKYDKYWGKPDLLNMLLVIALAFDPRRKFKFVDWMTTKVHGSDVATSLRAKLESCLKSIYAEYSGEVVSPQGNCTSQAGVFVDVGDPYDCSEFYQSARSSTSEYELNKYFEEDLEDRRPDFDLLAWWKVNSTRFPILAKIARDVLAIPISTVASESAFSNGGRILDEYRSSLTPTSVEALVCTQDWLEGARLCSLTSDDFDALERIEEEMFVTQDVSGSSSSIALNDD